MPKDSLTYKAIQYTLNPWDYLVGYLVDGRLSISNALAENAIRPFAVGRRNWLFADTARGARASATVYSLIETAKANRLEPYEYLRHVLAHIAAADTVEYCPGTPACQRRNKADSLALTISFHKSEIGRCFK